MTEPVRIATWDKPVIATLFGYRLGGDLELPLACHLRLAPSEGARIGLPELDLGTVPAGAAPLRGAADGRRCLTDFAVCFIVRT